MIRILDIGSGPASVAAQVFTHLEDKEIVRMDVNPDAHPDILHDITTPLPPECVGAFDIVYASHVMEHIDRIKVLETWRNLASALKHMGELWIVVPSLEWAASEILAQRETPQIQPHIFGGQHHPWDYHRCGFTLATMRVVMEINGLIVRKAYQSQFEILIDGETYPAIQNICIGARYDLNQPQEKRATPGAKARRIHKKRR